MTRLLVVYWEWDETTEHAGARFWAAHGTDRDGRLVDWPKHGMRPIGAAEVEVREGEGLELIEPIRAATIDWKAS